MNRLPEAPSGAKGTASLHDTAPETKPAGAASAPQEDASGTRERVRCHRPDLAALGLLFLSHEVPRDMERLGERTVAELFALTFDYFEADPAAAVLQAAIDDRALILAALSGDVVPVEDSVERARWRADWRARVALELHKRQRDALLDALREARIGGAL